MWWPFKKSVQQPEDDSWKSFDLGESHQIRSSNKSTATAAPVASYDEIQQYLDDCDREDVVRDILRRATVDVDGDVARMKQYRSASPQQQEAMLQDRVKELMDLEDLHNNLVKLHSNQLKIDAMHAAMIAEGHTVENSTASNPISDMFSEHPFLVGFFGADAYIRMTKKK